MELFNNEMTYFDIYLFTDQPTTCPKCGNRTEILIDFYDHLYKTQLYECMTINYGFQFLIEEDL